MSQFALWAEFFGSTGLLKQSLPGNLKIQLRLSDGFIAGVEQRRGFGAILRAKAFLLAGLSIFDVEHAAELAAVKDETMLHSSDSFFVRGYEPALGFGCNSYTRRAANPVFSSDCPVVAE